MAIPILYFIRHGQTDWNAEYRLQGQKDIPINEKGRGQAKQNGRNLAALLDDPSRFRYIASPLARTRETMEIVRRELGLTAHGYELEGRIKELSFGLWESFTFDELRIEHEGDVKLRFETKWDYVPPQGESYARLLSRVKAWLPYLEQDSVIVCHGGVLRVLMHHLGGLPKDEVVQFTVPQDQVFRWDGKTAEWLD